MSPEPHIFIKATHREPGSDELTGLSFTIEYGRATALVSIQEMPAVPFQDRRAAYERTCRVLAEALLLAARSPQAITENPQRPE
jgi:hypothetical protein